MIMLLLFIWLTIFPLNSSSVDENVRQACSVTRYKDICIRSLASYSKTAKDNDAAWARAGVSVALSDIKNTTRYLEKKNSTSRNISGKLDREALADCVECFHDALDNAHQSLGVLRKLDKVTFDQQLSDVVTWMSAALTDEDTCLDGFGEEERSERGGGRGKRSGRWRAKKMVIRRVRNCTYVTSNALALLNKLASTGL